MGWIVLVTVAVGIIVLAALSFAGKLNPAEWLVRLESTLTPSFGTGYNGPDLERSFTLLVRISIFFALSIVLWSAAAGTLEAGHVAGNSAVVPSRYAPDWSQDPQWLWLITLVGAVVLGAKLLGAAALMALSAALVGGFLGFLFGLPSRSAQDQAVAGQADKDANGAARWAPSTNLVQIADWLTKTIVGVSLVESKDLYKNFMALSHTASHDLLNNAYGTGVVVPAVLIGAGVLGFKVCNLYTLLFLARLIKEAGDLVSSLTPMQKAAVGTMAQMSQENPNPAVAPPIERTQTAVNFEAPSAQASTPTAEQQAAAVEISRKSLDSLSTYDTILAWARARAVLNDYLGAAHGYRKLIPMMQPPNPAILTEAARVYAQTGAMAEAKLALGTALGAQSSTAPRLRVPIVRDYVVLSLYEPKPKGYTDALGVLSDDVVDADPTGELSLLRACARAQKYAFETSLPEPERQKLHDAVISDIKTALDRRQPKAWIAFLADPNAPGKPPPGSVEREDDLEAFGNDPEFLAELERPRPV